MVKFYSLSGPSIGLAGLPSAQGPPPAAYQPGVAQPVADGSQR